LLTNLFKEDETEPTTKTSRWISRT